MESSETPDKRLGALTPEERHQIYEEERRSREAQAASTPPPPATATGAPSKRPALIAAGILVVVLVVAWIGRATPGSPDRDASDSSGGLLAATTETPTPAPQPRVDDIVLTAMQEDNDVLMVSANVAMEGAMTTLRVEGVEYPLIERKGNGYLFHDVKVPKLGENNAKLVIPAHGTDPLLEIPFTITRELRTIDEWRKYAQPLDYKRLIKNPDGQKGLAVKGRGQIYQITEGYGMTEGGLNVTPLGYSYWTDNVRFTMNSTTDFVEDDVVAFYGHVVGGYSYQSTAGWNLTAPMLQVEYMERG